MQETNFNDSKQANDKLYHKQLWSYLQDIGISLELLGIVQDMYTGDEYELVDGPTGAMRPVTGLKQGCRHAGVAYDVC